MNEIEKNALRAQIELAINGTLILGDAADKIINYVDSRFVAKEQPSSQNNHRAMTPEQRDCPYCHRPRKTLVFTMTDTAHINRSDVTGRPILDVYESYADKHISLPINYCPMCGRDLKGENK